MAAMGTQSGKYVGSAALPKYTALKAQGTNYGEVDVATAATDEPIGMAAQTGIQNDHVGYFVPGCGTVKGIASAAIAIGAAVTCTTAGKMVTVTKSATATGNFEWAWGYALSAAAADGDLFEFVFHPVEVEVT